MKVLIFLLKVSFVLRLPFVLSLQSDINNNFNGSLKAKKVIMNCVIFEMKDKIQLSNYSSERSHIIIQNFNLKSVLDLFDELTLSSLHCTRSKQSCISQNYTTEFAHYFIILAFPKKPFIAAMLTALGDDQDGPIIMIIDLVYS